MENFFDINDSLRPRCIRTLFQRMKEVSGQSGLLYSEGAYEWEIVNQSLTLELTLEIKGESVTLQRAFDQYLQLGVVDPNWKYSSFKFPGEPYLVRSDEVKFTWSKNSRVEQDLLIIRHMVIPFQEQSKNTYPVYGS